MQDMERLCEDATVVSAPPRRERQRRGTRPWQEVVDEYRASGLTIQAYSERSGISRASMTRYLAQARKGEQSDGTERAGSATGTQARTAAGFVRVGIVDRGVGPTYDESACDVPELIFGDGIRLRLPACAVERLLQALIDRIGAGAR